jgi:uncharacterized protein YcfJ
MSKMLKILTLASGLALAVQTQAQVAFFEGGDYAGRSFDSSRDINNMQRAGFNNRASSAVVRGERWEVCGARNYAGRCVILRQGNYPSLAAMGLNDSISSARVIRRSVRYSEDRYAPEPISRYDARRRNNERLFEAEITSVRAVLGRAQQRCWIESEQVVEERGSNAAGTLAGALIGGILGHQIGGGSGRDIATVGGAVAGAVVGSRVGDRGAQTRTQDVQRCATVSGNNRPEYWHVTYNFRGQEHRVQMSTRPGNTVIVNRNGEPRT